MTKDKKRESKPVPRLIHLKPGHFFTLASRDRSGKRFSPDGGRVHVMHDRCSNYAYYKDTKGGDAKVSLYHEVFPEGMVFGLGGWSKAL